MNNINWIPVISSNIQKLAYNKETKQMLVMFINYNAIYEHKNVGLELFNDFLNSESKGKFYARVFKNNPTYSIKRLK